MNKTYIREIFLSIQGEGPHIGEEQLFVRFCNCNLHCKFCDTDFDITKSKSYTPEELVQEISQYGENLVISLTGGEPLLSVNFLKEFLPRVKSIGHKIYLETNATLPENLKEILEYVDVVSADIKLPSATMEEVPMTLFEQFFEIASEKELFAKLVFNKDITDSEIEFALNLAKKYKFEIILQPEMRGNDFNVSVDEMERVFKLFRSKYDRVRLIPQMHKFLNVR